MLTPKLTVDQADELKDQFNALVDAATAGTEPEPPPDEPDLGAVLAALTTLSEQLDAINATLQAGLKEFEELDDITETNPLPVVNVPAPPR